MIERRKVRSANGVQSKSKSKDDTDVEMAKPRILTGRKLFPYILLLVPVVWFLIMLRVTLYVNVEDSKTASPRPEDGQISREPVVKSKESESSHNGGVKTDNVGYDEVISWKRSVETKDSYLVEKVPGKQTKYSKMRILHPHPGLGEAGAASLIDVNGLTPEEKLAFEQGDSVHHFNEFVSDKISLHRSVPDFRNPDCQAAFPYYAKDLPSVSIIICFYNEAWSTLLRTIHSVLDRTPVDLLHEILLVDDGSDLEDLGEGLEDYIASMPNVFLIRTRRRLGLVRARIEGIKFSTAPILVFLDSHCECGYGWLEPIIAPIKADPTAVVTPTIDVIDKDDFRINNADNNIGGFSAESMTFNWITVPPRINGYRKTLADPFVSPTLAGGLFAINKEYFLSIGTYDTGLEVWGGENLELSLKLWMCGGKIYISPCSRVGHIFRLKSPYVNVGDKFLTKNAARVAEVWLDEYKWFHFKTNPYSPTEHGDITEARELRKKLKCKHFDWYLETIYPELFISGSGDYFGMTFAGRSANIVLETGPNGRYDRRTRIIGYTSFDVETISHRGTGLCLSAPQWEQKVVMLPCTSGTIWESNKMLEIRHDVYCVEYFPELLTPYSTTCKQEQTTQVWIFKEPEGTFYHQQTNSCLTLSVDNTLGLEPCTGSLSQQWHWPRNPHFQFNRTAAAEMSRLAGW